MKVAKRSGHDLGESASYSDVLTQHFAAQIPSLGIQRNWVTLTIYMRANQIFIGCLLAIFAIGCGGSLTNHGIAQLRAISAVTNPSAIDVFTDFNLVATNLHVGEGSQYSNQTASDLAVGVRQFGDNQTIVAGNISLGVGDKATLIPYQTGAATVGLMGFLDDATTPAVGKFKLRVIHADRFIGLVDVYFAAPGADLSLETPIITNLNFEEGAGYIELNAGIPSEITITQAGTVNVIGTPLQLTPPSQAVRTLILMENGGPVLNIYND
jgi:hypothetical protein